VIKFIPVAVTKRDLFLRWVVVKCLEWLYQRYLIRGREHEGESLTPAAYAMQMIYSIFPDGYHEFKTVLSLMGQRYYLDAWEAK
jgi:hypothetical protein